MTEQIELPEEKKDSYIFGDFFGRMMSKTSLKFQYQASMMSFALIILSLLFYSVYTLGWGTQTIFWKVFTIMNSLCGVMILFSSLASTLQQYQQFMSIQQIQDLFSSAVPEVNEEIKKNDNLQVL